MRIEKKDDHLIIKDESKGIDCIMADSKIKGAGSRKHKEYIKQAISDYQTASLSKIFEPTKEKQKLFAGVGDIIANYNGRTAEYDYSLDQVHRFQSNPVRYNKELRNLSMYYYSKYGIVNQTYNLYRNYHSLESSLKSTNPKSNKAKEDKEKIAEFDNNILSKPLIRDIIFEAVSKGTAIGYLVGKNKNSVQMLDLDYYLPFRMIGGKWQCQVDLLKFVANYNQYKDMPNDWLPQNLEVTRELNFQPQEVRRAFRRYQSGNGDRIYNLQLDKTFVVKSMATQDERLGRPLCIGAIDDLIHKDLLRNAEIAVFERIISLMLVLNMGGSNKDCDIDLTEDEMKALYNQVKSVLQGDAKKGIRLFGLPHWAKLEPIKVDLDALNSNVFKRNEDSIIVSLGVQGILGGDTGQSFASGQLSLRILIANIFAILEQIEESLFNYQYSLLTEADDCVYTRSFNRSLIMDESKIVEVLKSMSDKGFSIKAVLDSIGVDFDDYIDQTLYETEELELQEKVKPYQSSATLSDKGGRPSGDNGDNGNSTPSPSD